MKKEKGKGKWIECDITKLVFGGCGLAYHAGKTVFVHNALPQEKVRARVTKAKRSHWEAIAEEILFASRIKPLEEHYLSCSPWQILEPSEEASWKQAIAQETLQSIGGIEFGQIDFSDAVSRTGYRNKMEFSFCSSDSGLSLAFFARASHRKVAIKSCVLADAIINEKANKIVNVLQSEGVRETALKSLIVRSSSQGEVMAGLFVTDSDFIQRFSNLKKSFEDLGLKGFAVFYSDAKSPASVVNEILWTHGDLHLEEHLNNKKLGYGLHSFFQINVKMFEQVLKDMSPFVHSQHIIDLYCGVGAIGIALGGLAQTTSFVDSSQHSVQDLKQNLLNHSMPNAKVICQPSEKALIPIPSDATVIVDPPRTGLHHKVLHQIRQALPSQIIYLSCNLSTCARDLAVFKHDYHISKIKCYNFFPMTPHFETLVVLEQT